MNDDSSPRKMLVTGISGLMGANFALAASKAAQVTGVYSRHPVGIAEVPCFPLDLRDPAATVAKLDQLKPATIVHFAAATDVDWCQEHPEEAVQINVETTGLLARWAAVNHCKFVFLSTDSVFDGARGGYVETDETDPVNIYATTKCHAEEVIRAATPNHLIIRSNIYGWNVQDKSSLAEWVLNNLKSGKQIKGFADVIFSPLLVNTLSEIMLQLIDRNETGTFHAASADAVSKYEFAVCIADAFGINPGLVEKSSLASLNLKAPRPLNTSLKTRKIDALGIATPQVRQDVIWFKQMYDSNYVTMIKGMNRPGL
jgi:dTDP-4-dehydrorhamnose reductase